MTATPAVEYPTKPQASVVPNLIAIASGKGGVGKTWVAASLAQALSFSGRRILLVDGDLGLANVDVQLGLEPRADVADAISGRRAFADCVTPAIGGAGARGGFDVLAGRSGSAVLSQLNPAEWRRLLGGLGALADFYDHAIVDLGAGVDETVVNLAGASAAIYVVLTDEPTSLTDAYALIKRLSQMGVTGRIELAVNMAQDHAEGRRTAETLIRAAQGFLNLALPVAAVIRRDPKVRDAIRRQQPFLSRHPQAPAAADVVAWAEDLSSKPAAAPARPALRIAAAAR
jgi:flagellar biosynthesis protein FlhG